MSITSGQMSATRGRKVLRVTRQVKLGSKFERFHEPLSGHFFMIFDSKNNHNQT